jgi:hypothetical protein
MNQVESKYERMDAIERLLARTPEGMTTGDGLDLRYHFDSKSEPLLCFHCYPKATWPCDLSA